MKHLKRVSVAKASEGGFLDNIFQEEIDAQFIVWLISIFKFRF